MVVVDFVRQKIFFVIFNIVKCIKDAMMTEIKKSVNGEGVVTVTTRTIDINSSNNVTVSDFVYVADRLYCGRFYIDSSVNAFLNEKRAEVFNEFVDDEWRFFIENHKNKYFLCDKDGGIVRIYEEDTEMVQVYEDVITYMVKMN